MSDINTLILKALNEKSLYGLEIIKYVENITNGKVVLKQPSLYSALRRFEQKKLVTSYWEDSEFGGKSHYYTITRLGKEVLNDRLSRNAPLSPVFFNDSQKNTNIKSYAPTSPNNSFSEVIKHYIEPDNNFISKKEDNIQKQQENSFEEILFPDVDEDLFFDEVLDDETEQNYEKSIAEKEKIDYKNILGDLFLDEETTSDFKTPISDSNIKLQQSHQLNTNITPTSLEQKTSEEDDNKKLIEKGHEHAREIERILSEQTSSEDKKINSESNIGVELLDEISKRHQNDKIEQPNFIKEENYSLSKQKKFDDIPSLNYMPLKRKSNKYLLINKLKWHSQIITSIFVLIEIIAFFAYYFVNNYLNLEEYILFGCSVLICLVIQLIFGIKYRNFPDKKIRKEYKWGLNLFYRFIAVALLLVCVGSINLLLGTSFNQFLEISVLLRWLLPSILIVNILFNWFITFILSKKNKYKI